MNGRWSPPRVLGTATMFILFLVAAVVSLSDLHRGS